MPAAGHKANKKLIQMIKQKNRKKQITQLIDPASLV